MLRFLPLLFIFGAGCASQKPTRKSFDPYNYTIQKETTVKNGAVVSAHPLASKVGVDILKRGGNAVDAAIATQWALAVVYPNAGNIGGGGFMVAHLRDGQTLALDFRETAPAAAHRDIYLDPQGAVIEGRSLRGPSSAGVPGTVAGLNASMKYAKLSWKELIQPAIDLAEGGYRITAREAASLNGLQSDLTKYNTTPNVFQRSRAWQLGDSLRQPDLAATLRRIRDAGPAGFYEGETAALIVAEMQRGGGYITLQDLKAYTAKWRTPHRFFYKGHEVVTMPPPSSGGVLLHQMMGMLENKPLPAYGFLSPKAVALMVEVERRAFADRAEFLGDPDFVKVPVSGLTSTTYLQNRMATYDSIRAGNSTSIQPGVLSGGESEETTHLSVVDADGNCVSVTTTLNDSYGSKSVVGGAGFLLNDEMDDFSVKPGVPNMYGAVGGEANAIAPGKRMLSSMTPTIVLKGGKPLLVIGTPGGTTIPTSVFQALIGIIDFGMSTRDVVNRPKFHHQWLPDEVFVESGFPQATRNALQRMGYTVTERGAIGRTEAIRILPNGRREAVADSRGDDGAEGY